MFCHFTVVPASHTLKPYWPSLHRGPEKTRVTTLVVVCCCIMAVCVAFYTPVGILGYYTFGSETVSDILDNYGDVKPSNLIHLPISQDIQMGRLAMAFTTSMSFPIMTYISRLAIFDILKVQDPTRWRPRLVHAAIQNVCVPIVCICATKAGLDLGFFIGLLGCSACVVVQLFFPGLMAMRMGYRVLGVALVVLSALQFSLGMFLTISGQHCKTPPASLGKFCNAIGSGSSPSGGDGGSGSGGSPAMLTVIDGV
jgi:hypothetical protein|eukprot:COSAG06_NODE_403_length_16181_cov_10.431911_5_plen_254_part_00